MSAEFRDIIEAADATQARSAIERLRNEGADRYYTWYWTGFGWEYRREQPLESSAAWASLVIETFSAIPAKHRFEYFVLGVQVPYLLWMMRAYPPGAVVGLEACVDAI